MNEIWVYKLANIYVKLTPVMSYVVYLMLPETISPVSCNGVTVGRKLQFVTSNQIWKTGCKQIDGHESRNLAFTTDSNLKIKFTISEVHLSGGVSSNITENNGYIADGSDNDIEISLSDNQDGTVIITRNNGANLVLPQDWQNILFLIGFQGN